MSSEQQVCYRCDTVHTRVCKCTHTHYEHIAGGGCKLCKCDRYDATKNAAEKSEDKRLLTEAAEEINLEKLLEDAVAAPVGELMAAQARVDELRKKAKEMHNG